VLELRLSPNAYPLFVLRRLMEGLKSTEVELGFYDSFAVCGKNEENEK
jgi:hypothetical protein